MSTNPGLRCRLFFQGEAGTGNVVEAVRHCRAVMGAIRQLQTMDEDELYVYAKEIRCRKKCGGQLWFLPYFELAQSLPRSQEHVQFRDLALHQPLHLLVYRAPIELIRQTKHLGRLPVVNFAAGGVATPADAALMMQLGMDGVFVGSGIFKSGDPASRARAIVQVCVI